MYKLRAASPLRIMIGPVGHQASCLCELTVTVDCGQPQLRYKRRNFVPLTECKRVLENHDGVGRYCSGGLKLRLDFLRRVHLESFEPNLGDVRRRLELLVGES